MSRARKAGQILLVVLVSIAVCTALILISGADPFQAYRQFFYGIFGNINGFAEVFVKATPLIFAGLAVAVAFQTGFFNIGAEGQFYMGAIGAAVAALYLPVGIPGVLRIILAFALGFAMGGLWALLAAVCKAKFGISEIISTIMLNYVAINTVGILVRGALQDKSDYLPQSAKFDAGMSLLEIMPPSRLNAGFLVALAAGIAVWFLMKYTTHGFEMRAVGLNSRAAHCTGISTAKNLILSAFLSGGLAGLAGVCEVLGIQHKLLEGISSDVGYTAILVALLAGTNPLLVMAAAVGFAAIQVGANTMQRQLGVPASIVSILIGLVVVLILGRGMLQRKTKKTGAQTGKAGDVS